MSKIGTVLRVAEDRNVTSIELDPVYCDMIATEHTGLELQAGP